MANITARGRDLLNDVCTRRLCAARNFVLDCLARRPFGGPVDDLAAAAALNYHARRHPFPSVGVARPVYAVDAIPDENVPEFSRPSLGTVLLHGFTMTSRLPVHARERTRQLAR